MPAAIAGMVFVLMLIAFRSVVIAIKAVISIALTQSIVYGMATCVYQYGVLNWTGFFGLQSTGGLCWVPPVLSFCISVWVVPIEGTIARASSQR